MTVKEAISKWQHLNSNQNLTLFDTIPPEILHMVDKYWYNWPPMQPYWFGLIGFVTTVLGVLSLIGNFMVIYVFTNVPSLRTPSNLFVVNLAFSDFMMMFTMFPPVLLNGIYRTWVLGPFWCELYGLCGSLFGCVSIWTMTLIAYDRYCVIVKGITRKHLTNKAAIRRLLFLWCACMAWALCPMFGWNRYVPEGNLTACGTDYFAKDWWNRSYIIVYGSWVYLTPLIIIIWSYSHIIQAVAGHEKLMRAQAKRMQVASLRSSSNDNGKSIEIKLAKIALVTISLWFVAWTPYTIINFAGILQSVHFSPLITICGSVFAKANAVYNPIVYALSHPKYQQVLREKLPWLYAYSSNNNKAVEDNNQSGGKGNDYNLSTTADVKSQATVEVSDTAA